MRTGSPWAVVAAIGTMVWSLAWAQISSAQDQAAPATAQSPAVASASSTAPPADIDFMAIPSHVDPTYAWTAGPARPAGTATIHAAKMVSQQWHGVAWTHDITLEIPEHSVAPDTAVIYLGGMNSGQTLDKAVAATGVACATVGGILGPLPADLAKPGADIISVSLAQYAATSDTTWIVLYPMTIAAIRSMDAIEAMTTKEGTPIHKFILTGWSKHGNIAWLAAAADPRVVGLIPLGSEALNIPQQMKSPAATGVMGDKQQLLKLPGIQKVLVLCDPYVYRDRLKMPILDVIGTKDHVNITGAMSCYWDGLPGEKYALVMANVGHNVMPDAAKSTYAFIRAVAAGRKLPTVVGKYSESAGKVTLHVTSSQAPNVAQAWTTYGEWSGLQGANWTSQALSGPGGAVVARAKDEPYVFDAEIDLPAKGVLGLFAELQFEDQGLAYSLTTPMWVGPGEKGNH